ncbi:complement factor I isoform X1 [Bufo gargarizans]|uniref:complement factor I isoform X1 n=1 Tax=Bufo gargarizans TaxID=30331 RepID=UPI001CF4E857|nr:complement factor I isoform X1 [Bufo gargarizans]
MKTWIPTWVMLSFVCICIRAGTVPQKTCWDEKYTINSCHKVFCAPWQRCVDGKCICKLPYQCPRNMTIGACSESKKNFINYCQLKSAECTNPKYRFSSATPCVGDTFETLLKDENPTKQKGIIKIKLPSQKSEFFVCPEKWTITEANVACRQLQYSQGAFSEDLQYDLSETDDSQLECLQVTCRGSETTLAECSIKKSTSTSNMRAGVSCYKETHECGQDQFTCVNKKCIARNQTCNGQNDCGDLSDELCCTECKGAFHCKSDICIPLDYECNGEVDCISGEDEVGCKERTDARSEKPVSGVNERTEARSENPVSGVNEGSNALKYDINAERRLIKESIPSLSCGVAKQEHTRVKRIVGGQKAEKNQFPWQVAIKDGSKVNCGGIYIGGCFVLTAAHCVRSDQAHKYRIIVELLDRLAYDKDIDSFPVKSVKVHELYNPNTYENDIALLEVVNIYNEPACMQVDNNLLAACVPWSPYQFKEGDICTVSGWGRSEGLSKVFHLKWGHISLMNNCSTVYKGRFFDKMECAGTYDGSIDSCKGDSGGPLICRDAENVAYVWGIVSWGENCGLPGYPGVYTKVAHYFEWISRQVGRQLIAKYNI